MIDDATRRLMYGNDGTDMKKFVEKSKEVMQTKESRDVVFLEMAGKKHRVPSFFAYNQLLKEHTNTKNELQKAQADIKKLTETIKKLDNAVKVVEIELASKADIYGDNN